MQVFRSAAIVAAFPRRPVSARTLRMWCTPEVILAVTTLSDEQTLLPHVIGQARKCGARIILAHVHHLPEIVRRSNKPDAPQNSGIREAREALDRMARQLRWLGFTCEPLLLTGPPEIDIPYLVRSCCVDRVLLGFELHPVSTTKKAATISEQVLRTVDVPVCVIGRSVMRTAGAAIRNVTLAISAESNCEVPLSFASRLAQEFRANLTVLHVAKRKSGYGGISISQSVIDRLPLSTWREAELFCPTQISIREGDAADEILSHCVSTQQDLLVLCSPGNTASSEAWRSGIGYQIVSGARCPVLIAKDKPHAAVVKQPLVPEKFSPEKVEQIHEEERRQISGNTKH